MVLMGIAGATAMDVISILRKKRADLTGFKSAITGERAETNRSKYTKFIVRYVLEGRRALLKGCGALHRTVCDQIRAAAHQFNEGPVKRATWIIDKEWMREKEKNSSEDRYEPEIQEIPRAGRCLTD